MHVVSKVQPVVRYIFENRRYLRSPYNPAQRTPIRRHRIKISRKSIRTIIRGRRSVAARISSVIHRITADTRVQTTVLEVPHENMPHILRSRLSVHSRRAFFAGICFRKAILAGRPMRWPRSRYFTSKKPFKYK